MDVMRLDVGGCTILTDVVVSIVSARIILSLVSSLRGDYCRCWGICFDCVGQVFYGRYECICWCDSWSGNIFVLVKDSS